MHTPLQRRISYSNLHVIAAAVFAVKHFLERRLACVIASICLLVTFLKQMAGFL